MPSFLKIKAWYALANNNVPHRDLRQDSQFPWTPEFTKSIVGCIDDLQRKVEEQGLGEVKLPVDPSKEKALAEARAKVTPLTPAQKALAAMMSMSDEPDASWLEVKEDERESLPCSRRK
ncbi:hypothetical protein H9Q74_013103 [Fusarium xylarioides]|nr:hypothetical protein H9Q71_013181 [Fusarium xylarioides]KAG5812499.1 hypothetical protein H9Q74_013103 [Fusarium xylarioides]